VTGGDWDRQAIVWDTRTGRPIRHLRDPTTSDQETVAVRWSPDGSIVATGGGQGKVILWRAADWRRLAALPADSSWVWCLAFSRDGSLLAADGAGGRSATVWNVASRKLVARLPHSLILGSVAIDPGDKLLATSAADGKVRLWDIASQRQIGVAFPGAENGSGINVSAFGPSGKRLIAVYDTGTAFVWDINPDRWKEQACAVVGRPLSPEEWKKLLPDRRYQPACQ
jgi:WD40 repeat protein